MTLEDFFTLTEMNNGLTVPSRVEEFMAIMQKERDCIVKNAGDATRQWSAVAKAISATENKECLNLFIKLDGLQFIAKWLKDSQKFSNELSDTLLEESIYHLLQALEKLNLDFEKVVDAEIWTTVEDLIVHNSTKVQDKARMLFESWVRKRDGEKIVAVSDYKIGKNVDNERDNEFSLKNASLSKEIPDEEKGKESTGDDPVLTLSSDNVQTDQVENGHNSTKNDVSVGPASSASLSVMEPTSVQSCSPVVSRQDTVDGQTEFNQLESSSDIKQTPKIESSQEQLGLLGENNSSEDKFFTSGSSADAMKSATELNAQRFTFTEDKKFGRKFDSDEKGPMDDSGSANQCRSSSAFTADKRGESNHHMLHKSSNDEQSWENSKKLGAFPSRIENDGNTNNLDQHVNGGELKNDHDFVKQEMEKKSDNELEYGIVDPLEVARQVAIEVERDNREQSSIFSEKLPEGNLRKPDRTETQSHASEGPLNDVEDELNSSPFQEESVTSSENLETKETNDTQEMETSQITEMAQEEVADTERGLCDFDLNQNICSEDNNDHPANQNPAPVSIVSASRAAAAAPRLPVSPLQFEGNLGWKGSAATSAFRPASPRRVLESDKDLSIGRSNLNFDLNVAENVGLPESSSVETHSRKSERLELDLNLTSEDGGPPTDWQMGQLFPQGNDHSSSSSTKQPSLRNFNLNDQPSFLNDPSENSFLSKLSQSYNGVKSDDSVISIMGRRVEVNRKDTIPTFPLPNGQTPELGFDVTMGRPGNFLGIGPVIPYSHSSAYGYNNIAVGPAMPFSSTVYGSSGPIPYMVDSKGSTVIPQFVGGPASALPTAFSQQPFFVNMTSSNEVGPIGPIGPPRGSFDVNTGMMVGNGSRDPSGFSQFLNSGQLRSMDGSVVGGKRKEPENGLENYPFKHYMRPPWK